MRVPIPAKAEQGRWGRLTLSSPRSRFTRKGKGFGARAWPAGQWCQTGHRFYGVDGWGNPICDPYPSAEVFAQPRGMGARWVRCNLPCPADSPWAGKPFCCPPAR